MGGTTRSRYVHFRGNVKLHRNIKPLDLFGELTYINDEIALGVPEYCSRQRHQEAGSCWRIVLSTGLVARRSVEASHSRPSGTLATEYHVPDPSKNQ